MKKLILGSAIVAILGVASNAMAAPNTGTVNFTGSVTSATCNIDLKDSSGSNISTVDLGAITTTAANGSTVNFKLIPEGEGDCLSKAAATMTWSSPTLNAMGIGNSVANGTNAVMFLSATNATTNDRAVKQGNTTFDYNVTSGIKSFDYTAVLAKSGNTAFTAGAFSATATYSVAYK